MVLSFPAIKTGTPLGVPAEEKAFDLNSSDELVSTIRLLTLHLTDYATGITSASTP
jgi:hypothetical protein